MTVGLAALQDRLQRAILDGDDAVLPLVRDSTREKRATLLGVHRHGYVLRLIEALKVEYEYLLALLGPDEFTAAARAYISAHPSRLPNIRWMGARLPEFLATAEPYGGRPVIADLARLEKALNDAFDAADAEVATPDLLTLVPPEDWGGLVFGFHPSVRLVTLATNAADILAAIRDRCEPPHSVSLEREERYVVWRQQDIARFRRLEAEEALALASSLDGVPFGMLCERIATVSGAATAARAAGYLSGWFHSGLIRSKEQRPAQI
jgi:hypothetical protein